MRAMTITETVTMVSEECCNCGVLFALTADYQRRMIDSHDRFYCPNGHGQSYTGKTDEQKAIERAERAERQREQMERRLANAQEDARAAHASLVATKGHLTRMRRRIANGVCPCCSRAFTNVRRHMETQHPDVLARVQQDEAAREVTL